MQVNSITPDFLDSIDNIIFDLGGVIVGLDEQLTKDAFNEIIGINEIAGTEYTEYFHKIERGRSQILILEQCFAGLQKRTTSLSPQMNNLTTHGIR